MGEGAYWQDIHSIGFSPFLFIISVEHFDNKIYTAFYWLYPQAKCKAVLPS